MCQSCLRQLLLYFLILIAQSVLCEYNTYYNQLTQNLSEPHSISGDATVYHKLNYDLQDIDETVSNVSSINSEQPLALFVSSNVTLAPTAHELFNETITIVNTTVTVSPSSISTLVINSLVEPTSRTIKPPSQLFAALNQQTEKHMNTIKPTQSVSSSASGNLSTTSNTLKASKTSAPMLNYIYDAYLANNKHYHYDHRYGPHFEDAGSKGNATNVTVTVQAGKTAFLNCRISLLQDKTVSWVRRKPDDTNQLQLLTVGMHTYSGDSRYTVELQYPNNWRLKIAYANKHDEGSYECQISTHPPKVIQIYLKVNVPEVIIVDEHGNPLLDKYYEVDSTIQLTCNVRYISMTTSVVFWIHGNRTLNYDITRGGISVKTDLMENGATSILSIAKVNKSDSGNYTCSIGSNVQFTTMVHVLNEESLAELYHGDASTLLILNNLNNKFFNFNFILIILIVFLVNNLKQILGINFNFYIQR